MKNIYRILFSICMICFMLPAAASATTRDAGTYAQLTTAINSSANSGDIINITANIVVTAEIGISKSLTFNGNGYTITVTNPGLDEMGRFNSSASTWRVFYFSGGTSTINNLTIKGGNVSSAGGAIYISASAILTLNNCTVSNSRTSGFVGGGGIYNLSGVLYMNGCYIRRNSAEYGGGMLNEGGTAYMESCTMVENRATSANGAGGAVENKNGGKMYFNNSTVSNNQSYVYGGAFNNYNSTLYFINSSATGNVVFSAPSGCKGGVVLNLNSSANFYAVNSLFAYNYKSTSGTDTNPTGYVLDDIIGYFSADNQRMNLYNCVYHANLPSPIGAASVSNIQYTGNMNGSNNTIFSDGVLAKITDNNGTEIGDPIYRPFLYNNQGSVAPTLQSGSFLLSAANRGTRTRYANNNNVSPAVAYYNGSSYVNLTGTSASGQEVLLDQVGDARPDPPVRGAIEGIVSNLVMVKVLVSANGTVNGGTFYGDVYPGGTSVTLTAIPNSGYEFTRYDYVLGGSGTASTANPYTFTANSDITLQPVFTVLPSNNYSVTYLGNGNTGGTAPVDVTFSGSTTIAAPGTLVKTGYTFSGWNTNANGSGTSYAAGATYSTAANLVLFAKWTLDLVWNWTGTSSTAWSTAGNWSRSDLATATVPTVTDNVVISDKDNDPVIASAVGANCNSLTVNSGASLTVNSGGSLITNGSITNNGTISIKRDMSASTWHLVSSPVTSATASIFLGDYLQSWSEGSHTWTDITNPDASLQPLHGYGLWATPSKAPSASYTFTGTPNTGNQSQAISFTEYSSDPLANEGANLLGNPYPSAIDWEGLRTTYGAVYYWNGSIYVSWNGSGTGSRYIPTMQGFFIVTASNGTFSLTNANRTHTMSGYYKSAEETKDKLLVLETVSQGISDKLFVNFNDQATEDFDLQHDAYKFASGTAGLSELYSYTGDKKLSIDVRPACDVVQLGFTNSHSGDYSIGINQVNGIAKATLEDTKTNTFTDLLKGSYSFGYTAGESDQRFKLHMGALGIGDIETTAASIYSYQKTMFVNLKDNAKGDVYIYNMSGQLVASMPSASGMNRINLDNTGNYIVKVITEKNTVVRKVFVK